MKFHSTLLARVHGIMYYPGDVAKPLRWEIGKCRHCGCRGLRDKVKVEVERWLWWQL
jgi:hypothetical protein